jgi:Glycosyl transferase family 2
MTSDPLYVRRGKGRPRVVGLLPARNAASYLAGYFDSVAAVVDAVVALDDGSTDETGELLEAQPTVEVLLRNPRRPTYHGWDDSANRNRLLAAAAELEPAWILFLDSDERLDPDDAAALRAFIDHEAIEGYVYGMRVFRMIGGLRYWDRGALWVYRLFAPNGDSLPEQRLHFVPVPRSIPMERWLQTTIRIQHLASLTEARRRARFEKYREADPDNRFQPSYTSLLEQPAELKLWERRPPGLAVLENGSSNGGWPAA